MYRYDVNITKMRSLPAGRVPESITQLTRLQVLNLRMNRLTGAHICLPMLFLISWMNLTPSLLVLQAPSHRGCPPSPS